MDSRIVYEDDDVLVCEKAAGEAVQSSKIGEKDLESELRSYLKRKGSDPYLAIVHRLDQPVRGLLVFAKTREAAANLSKQVTRGETGMGKEYRATVYGRMPDTKGVLEDLMLKDGRSGVSRVLSEEEKEACIADEGRGCGALGGAKKARLSYEVIEEGEKTQTLLIRLDTGRFHQIRAQLAAAGAPILGDRKYGNDESLRFAEDKGIGGIELCACRLVFKHPKDGRKMEFVIDKK